MPILPQKSDVYEDNKCRIFSCLCPSRVPSEEFSCRESLCSLPWRDFMASPPLQMYFSFLATRWKQQQQETDQKWTTKWVEIRTEWLSVFNEPNRKNFAKISRNVLLVMIAQHTWWWKMWCVDKEHLTECNTCKRKIKVNEHRTVNWTSHLHNWDLKRSLNLQVYIMLIGWIECFS